MMPIRSLGRAAMNLETTDLDDGQPIGALAVELEIERLHRSRDVERQHHVDAARLDLAAGVATCGRASATISKAAAGRRR